MPLKQQQMPWRHILMDSTWAVMGRARASDRFWHVLQHLSALGPHSDLHRTRLHRGLPLTLTGLLVGWVGMESRMFIYVQKEDRTSSAVALWTGQCCKLDFLWTWRHLAPTKRWFWTPSVIPSCPHFILKSTQPLKQQPGDGRWPGNSPIPIHKALLTVSTASVDTISSSSIVSAGGRSGLHHFPSVTLQKHYAAKERLCHRKGLTNWQFSSDFLWAVGEGTYFLLQKHSANLYCSQLILLLLINVCSCNALKVFS